MVAREAALSRFVMWINWPMVIESPCNYIEKSPHEHNPPKTVENFVMRCEINLQTR